MIETPEFAAMMRRMVRAYGRRVGDADPVDLEEMVALRDHLEAAIEEAVAGQKRSFSWAEVAEGLGVTREAAWKRYGKKKPRSKADVDAA